MKALLTAAALALGLLASPAAFADAKAMCEKSAADKKLAGAAKDSHIKKCIADAGGAAGSAQAACEKSAADKKLAGAAKDSHIKKCVADAAGAKK
jgi:hypothetical protein